MSSLQGDADADIEYVFKVLLLGESGVGKTHLAARFVEGRVGSNSEPTIGVEFASKVIPRDDGDLVRLQIWDTAGSRRFQHHNLGEVYRHAVCAFLVYDKTARESFDALQNWIDSLHATSKLDTSSMVVVVCGNKCDLPDPVVSTEDGMSFAKEHGFLFAETSAGKNIGVSALFELACDALVDIAREDTANPLTPSPCPASSEPDTPTTPGGQGGLSSDTRPGTRHADPSEGVAGDVPKPASRDAGRAGEARGSSPGVRDPEAANGRGSSLPVDRGEGAKKSPSQQGTHVTLGASAADDTAGNHPSSPASSDGDRGSVATFDETPQAPPPEEDQIPFPMPMEQLKSSVDFKPVPPEERPTEEVPDIRDRPGKKKGDKKDGGCQCCVLQ